MNFLIFRDFLEFFKKFYEFNWIYFELYLLKTLFYRVLMWQLTWCERNERRHMAVYECATWHMCM